MAVSRKHMGVAPIDFDNAFVVVRACEDCEFFMDGVEGFLSGDYVLEGEQTHRERHPAHRIASERYPLKAESGRWSAQVEEASA